MICCGLLAGQDGYVTSYVPMDDLEEPLVEPLPIAILVIPDEIPVLQEDEIPSYNSDMEDFWDRFPRVRFCYNRTCCPLFVYL